MQIYKEWQWKLVRNLNKMQLSWLHIEKKWCPPSTAVDMARHRGSWEWHVDRRCWVQMDEDGGGSTVQSIGCIAQLEKCRS